MHRLNIGLLRISDCGDAVAYMGGENRKSFVVCKCFLHLRKVCEKFLFFLYNFLADEMNRVPTIKIYASVCNSGILCTFAGTKLA